MKARVHITLKKGVLDPQGAAVRHSLRTLGFTGIEKVRQGKVIDIELSEQKPDKALELVNEMCRKLLANAVIEDFTVELIK